MTSSQFSQTSSFPRSFLPTSLVRAKRTPLTFPRQTSTLWQSNYQHIKTEYGAMIFLTRLSIESQATAIEQQQRTRSRPIGRSRQRNHLNSAAAKPHWYWDYQPCVTQMQKCRLSCFYENNNQGTAKAESDLSSRTRRYC